MCIDFIFVSYKFVLEALIFLRKIVKCIHGSGQSLGTREWERKGEGIVQDDSLIDLFFSLFSTLLRLSRW